MFPLFFETEQSGNDRFRTLPSFTRFRGLSRHMLLHQPKHDDAPDYIRKQLQQYAVYDFPAAEMRGAML